MKSRFQKLLLIWVLSSVLGGCRELDRGIEAYQFGEFATAIQLLRPFAEKHSKEPRPIMKVSLKNTSIQDAIPTLSERYFLGWQAYVGSLLNVGPLEQACQALRFSLLPIRVSANEQEVMEFDPLKNEVEWPMEVYTLRAWWGDPGLNCQYE